MAVNKKSLNQLWRELGKPVPFKEFAEEYNKADLYGKDIKSFYHNATGATDDNSTPPTQTLPSVTVDYSKYYLVATVVVVLAIIIISKKVGKKQS